MWFESSANLKMSTTLHPVIKEKTNKKEWFKMFWHPPQFLWPIQCLASCKTICTALFWVHWHWGLVLHRSVALSSQQPYPLSWASEALSYLQPPNHSGPAWPPAIGSVGGWGVLGPGIPTELSPEFDVSAFPCIISVPHAGAVIYIHITH